MEKWEYRYVSIPDSEAGDTILILNEAGKDGWEYIGDRDDSGYGQSYMMKRKVVS